jgi:hypothetical protein
LDLIEESVYRHRIVVRSDALMENHYHMIVQTPEANLSAAMQWLGVSCSRDWGRDLALHIGRRKGGMKLRELGEKAGAMDYGSVAIALHRFGKKLKEHPPLRTAHQKIQKLIVIK